MQLNIKINSINRMVGATQVSGQILDSAGVPIAGSVFSILAKTESIALVDSLEPANHSVVFTEITS